MTRLVLLALGCALAGAVFAAPSTAQTEDAEKAAAKQHAKRVLVRRARKVGIVFRTSEVSARCIRRTDFWSCKTKANNETGACEATMRLYNAAGPFHATNVRIGCVPPPPTPPE
jgi:hypothetical protein